MILSFVILFGAAMGGGLLAHFVGIKQQSIRYPLIFAGSFLFSITIIHILPEIFAASDGDMKLGLYVLMGFFFQQLLEYFTSGIEHGHAHIHGEMSVGSQFGLAIALVVHSVLEGALLTHQSPIHDQHESYSLLIGIVLHKAPAAFALVTTLKASSHTALKVWIVLLVFSISSPLGLLFSDFIHFSGDVLLLLYAFVSGSFLHISTTIFVESSPNHHFGLKKFLISVLGAMIAIATEFLL